MTYRAVIAVCVALSAIGCGGKSVPDKTLPPGRDVSVLRHGDYTFHLDAESTRLVVFRGDDVVKWDALSDLCLELNAGSMPRDAVEIQGLQLTRREIDGTRPDMAVEGSDGIAVIYVKVDGEWREVIAERFDAGFSTCTMGSRGLFEAMVPPER